MDPITRHLASLEADRYSPMTIRDRRRILGTYPGDPLTATRDDALAWWASRLNKPDGTPRSPVGLTADAAHMRSFWRWAIQEGLIDRNPGDWLPRIRKARTMAVAVTESDLHRLLTDAPDDVRRMVALAAMAGLRSAEIAAVTWEDIDRDNGCLWVRHGKGAKDRPVPLSGGLLAELGNPGTGFIAGRPMSAKAVSARLGRYLRGRSVDLTAHKLRARYATRFLAATGDAVAAAQALGHADLSSILRYAVPSSDVMRKGAEAAGRIG